MKIYHLFHVILQTTKENRLVFDGPEAPRAESEAPKRKNEAPRDKVEVQKTLHEVLDKINKKVDYLEGSMESVVGAKEGTYTAEAIDHVKELQKQVQALKAKLKNVKGENLIEDQLDQLKKFNVEILDLLREYVATIILKSKPKPGSADAVPLSSDQAATATEKPTEKLFATLQTRFESNMKLHKGVKWTRVKSALEKNPAALESIDKMEKEGHEPDVYFADKKGFDIGTTSKEGPQRGLNSVYDEEAERSCSELHPDEKFNGNAVAMAKAMGVDLMTPEQYERKLQKNGEFDYIGWVHLKTDDATRENGYAFVGARVQENDDEFHNDEVRVYPGYADGHYDHGSWRGSLRINWAR